MLTGIRRPRVLVVSQEAAGEVLTDLSTVLDCEVERATTPATALKEPYDVLVLDVRPADSDAWTLAKLLRRIGFRGPIIGLTVTPPSMVDRDRAQRVGAALLQAPLELAAVGRILTDSCLKGWPPGGRPAVSPLASTLRGG